MSAPPIAFWTSTRLAFVLLPDASSSAPPLLESSAHEETSSSQRKRPIVSRSALSSTGRNSVSRNAPKPSSPSHGCSRPAWPGHGIGAVAEARVELLDERVVGLAGEAGGEGDLRLEADVDAVGGRHAQVVDADAVAAAGRARDDVAPRRALRRVQARVLREPARPRQPGGRRDQLALGLLVERAAVVDDADLVRPGAREARQREQRDDDQRAARCRWPRSPNATPRSGPRAARPRRAGGSASPVRPQGPYAQCTARARRALKGSVHGGSQDYHRGALAGVV